MNAAAHTLPSRSKVYPFPLSAARPAMGRKPSIVGFSIFLLTLALFLMVAFWQNTQVRQLTDRVSGLEQQAVHLQAEHSQHKETVRTLSPPR